MITGTRGTRGDIPLNFASLHRAYAQGTRPEAIVTQIFARIEAVADPGIFICLFSKDELLTKAAALGAFDPGKPLWGIPFAIKDNIDVARQPTTAACPEFAYVPDKTAFVVERLQEAGAILIGKTNLDQFATGLVGVRTPYGAPRNALDPKIVPGGSSAGSGVCVAHGIASFALGTDTAGSGRVPAALNNIVGLKPTLGALSASGVVPACRSVETVSIFALNVPDAYAAFAAAAVFDPSDAYARPSQTPPLTLPPPRPKIGIPSQGSIRFEGDAAQAQSFTDTTARLKESGAELTEIDFTPLYEIAEMLYFGPWVAERYAATERLMTTRPEALFPVTRKIISTAEGKTATETFKAMYRLKELAAQMAPKIDACDALCVPSIPTFVTLSEIAADPLGPNNMLGTYTNFVNLLDLCAIAVPTPARPDGRPGSVTFIGKAGADAKLAALAASVEAWGTRNLGATGWPVLAAPLPDGPAEDSIRIAVCGAHMTGLALNHTLTDRGATFAKSSETAPDYRLLALTDGDIPRPGLVRTAPGTGARIKLELWDMPLTAFGSFMKTIPAPLGIGSLTLSGGQSVQGFLCEAIAAENAEDITDLGGWRAYLERA